MAKKKLGAISQEDRKFILENMNKMTIDEIAEKTGRDVLIVEKVIKTHTSLPDANNQTARWHLKRSNYWKQLREGFDEVELSHIEDEYIKIISQFKENIVATEEAQILDLIKVGVLQDRNLKSKQKIIENLEDYSRMIKDLEDATQGNFAELSEEDRETIMKLKNQQAACMQAESNRTTEYLNLQKQKNELYDKVMGSRHQRVTEILNNKTSFTGYVQQLLERDKQDEESRFIQLYAKATEKELERISAPFTYSDNQTDNPVLSAEVIEMLEKDEKN